MNQLARNRHVGKTYENFFKQMRKEIENRKEEEKFNEPLKIVRERSSSDVSEIGKKIDQEKR
jgi:hypothetical protein